MRLLKPTLLVVPLAALALAGCGGGGDSTESTQAKAAEPAALSKAELIVQGDAICAEVNAAVGSVGSSETEGAGQATQVADLYAGMVEGLKELGKPQEAAGYDEFIVAAEELSKYEGEAKLAAEREDSEALASAETNAASALEEFQTSANTFGFKECAEGPSAPTPRPESGGSSGGTSESPSTGGLEEEAPTPEAEEVAPEVEEPVVPETGGAGSAPEEATPEGGGTGTGAPEGEAGGSSGGIGPG